MLWHMHHTRPRAECQCPWCACFRPQVHGSRSGPRVAARSTARKPAKRRTARQDFSGSDSEEEGDGDVSLSESEGEGEGAEQAARRRQGAAARQQGQERGRKQQPYPHPKTQPRPLPLSMLPGAVRTTVLPLPKALSLRAGAQQEEQQEEGGGSDRRQQQQQGEYRMQRSPEDQFSDDGGADADGLDDQQGTGFATTASAAAAWRRHSMADSEDEQVLTGAHQFQQQQGGGGRGRGRQQQQQQFSNLSPVPNRLGVSSMSPLHSFLSPKQHQLLMSPSSRLLMSPSAASADTANPVDAAGAGSGGGAGGPGGSAEGSGACSSPLLQQRAAQRGLNGVEAAGRLPACGLRHTFLFRI